MTQHSEKSSRERRRRTSEEASDCGGRLVIVVVVERGHGMGGHMYESSIDIYRYFGVGLPVDGDVLAIVGSGARWEGYGLR
jgi:hypothetical protein